MKITGDRGVLAAWCFFIEFRALLWECHFALPQAAKADSTLHCAKPNMNAAVGAKQDLAALISRIQRTVEEIEWPLAASPTVRKGSTTISRRCCA
jgi:hypothetical protein